MLKVLSKKYELPVDLTLAPNTLLSWQIIEQPTLRL